MRVALDDFGTGYSSLSHLRQFDIDRVRIDRWFMNGIERGNDGRAMIQPIVDLARGTRLEVTAEGVETPVQSRFLSAIGCNELQGYLLGRPMHLTDLDKFLKSVPLPA